MLKHILCNYQDPIVKEENNEKILSVVLAVALVCVLSTFVQADSGNTASEQILEHLAQQHILVEVTTTEDKVTTVYSGLEEFYDAVHEECPSVTDSELAWFTVEYTDSEAYRNECNALEILDVKSMITEKQYVLVEENSTTRIVTFSEAERIMSNSNISPATADEWETDYGCVLFEYEIYERDTVITETGVEWGYYVCVSTDWQTMPVNRWQDTLGIAYAAAFDDSADINSTIRQTGGCAYCGKTFFLQEREKYNARDGVYSETSSYLNFDYSGNAIATQISMRPFACYHLNGEVLVDYYRPSEIYAYLGFNVIISEVGEMRVAYAHATLGSDISITASASNGLVSVDFSAFLTTFYQKYVSAPRTLHIT